MNLLIPDLAATFLITFARVGALIMLMPGLGERLVLARARLALALLTALVLFPFTSNLISLKGLPTHTIGLFLSEIFIGLFIGLSGRIVFGALQTAGTIIAQQLGLAFAMSVDPTVGGQQASISNFLTMLGLTLIFTADLHHIALMGISESYILMPPGLMPPMGDISALILKAVTLSFKLSVQISAPFIVFGVLFNFGVGILSRLMPQLQVFFLAMPATILGGMILLAASLGVVMGVFIEGLGSFLAELGGR
jgi:flagellar biosynthesis protein FliR